VSAFLIFALDVFDVQRLYRNVKHLIVEARTQWQSPPAS